MLCENTTAAIKLKEGVCNGLQEELQQLRGGCEAQQHGLDEAVCGLAAVMDSTCMGYKACRSQATLSYDLGRHNIEQRLMALREEWTALQRIECLLRVLGAGAEAVVQCQSATYSA